MPRRDGTGPQGLGPMTGRGMGFCAAYEEAEFQSVQGKSQYQPFSFPRLRLARRWRHGRRNR